MLVLSSSTLCVPQIRDKYATTNALPKQPNMEPFTMSKNKKKKKQHQQLQQEQHHH